MNIINLPPDKRLPTLAEYLSLLVPYGDHDNAQINEIGLVTSGRDAIFTPVRVSNTKYSLVPGPEFCPRLYRGQTQDYGSCKAGLYRQRSSYGDWLYWKIKQVDLLGVIERHPAVLEMQRCWKIGGLGLGISLNSIAQHYGYKTDILDLTRSKNVAMFFATHDYVSNAWVPAIGRRAVLYTADLKSLAAAGVFPIGIEPFPRPFAQRAFGIQLGPADDFSRMPGVKAEHFDVTEEIAQSAREALGNVSALFPHDPFDQFFDRQLGNRHVHKDSIAKAFLMGHLHDMSYHDVEQHLYKANYTIATKPVEQPNDLTINAAEAVWCEMRNTYTQSIDVRYVADHINLGRKV